MEKEICEKKTAPLYLSHINAVLFRFGHIRRWDQCAVYILYSKISTDPGLLKIRHSHRFVAVVIQFLIPLILFSVLNTFIRICNLIYQLCSC